MSRQRRGFESPTQRYEPLSDLDGFFESLRSSTNDREVEAEEPAVIREGIPEEIQDLLSDDSQSFVINFIQTEGQ